MSEVGFEVTVDQNRYLPDGGRHVDAIVTVRADTGDAPPGGPRPAQVIVLDCSGSMDHPHTKLTEAKRATCAAIDALHAGVDFAIVAGANGAIQVYPPTGLAPATPDRKAAAKAALESLRADGGTRIGRWLNLANHVLADRQGGVRHVILLTDGQNQHETREQLDAVLRSCEGRFTCDCRGVGTGWAVDELRLISSTLLGSVDIVADPAALAADFRSMAERALGRSVVDVSLRLWTPQGSSIRFVKQVSPVVEDLTARRHDCGPRTGDYPTGAWGDEVREYHVGVDVPPSAVGEQVLAARASIVVTGTDEARSDHVAGQGLVLAEWTDDEARAGRVSRSVAHYTGQAELAGAIQEGLDAAGRGDQDRATARLGRAVQLAAESGNAETTALLSAVVDVVDADTGVVRLKGMVSAEARMTLDTRSTRTVRVLRRGPDAAPADAEPADAEPADAAPADAAPADAEPAEAEPEEGS